MKQTALPFSIYVLGIVLAISAAAKVPAEGHTWPDTLPLFGLGIAVCIAGLVAWHRAVGRGAGGPTGDSEGLDQMLAQVRSAEQEARVLVDQWDELDGSAICARIDRLLLDSIDPVVENRNQWIRRHGMREGAELILALATAERRLNRVWSASADNAPDEARTSLDSAVSALDELLASLEAK